MFHFRKKTFLVSFFFIFISLTHDAYASKIYYEFSFLAECEFAGGTFCGISNQRVSIGTDSVASISGTRIKEVYINEDLYNPVNTSLFGTSNKIYDDGLNFNADVYFYNPLYGENGIFNSRFGLGFSLNDPTIFKIIGNYNVRTRGTYLATVPLPRSYILLLTSLILIYSISKFTKPHNREDKMLT